MQIIQFQMILNYLSPKMNWKIVTKNEDNITIKSHNLVLRSKLPCKTYNQKAYFN